MRSLVLLSGGLDSAVVLARLVGADRECEAVGFDYGQRHIIELDHAEQIARYFCIPFEIVRLPLMPLINEVVFAGRNLVLAAHGVALAQARGFDEVAVGCNASDWFHFPDCRPPFWHSIEGAAAGYGVKVITPLIHHPKSAVIQAARDLKVPIELTWSCYNPCGEKPCGECLACKTRMEAGA